jgi:hypothetical protein
VATKKAVKPKAKATKKATKKVKAKRTRYVEEPLPEGFPAIGSLVRYYDEGWRHGYLVVVKRKVATIRTIGGTCQTAKFPITEIVIPRRKK